MPCDVGDALGCRECPGGCTVWGAVGCSTEKLWGPRCMSRCMERSVLRCADVLGLPYGLCSMKRMELGGLERSS